MSGTIQCRRKQENGRIDIDKGSLARVVVRQLQTVLTVTWKVIDWLNLLHKRGVKHRWLLETTFFGGRLELYVCYAPDQIGPESASVTSSSSSSEKSPVLSLEKLPMVLFRGRPSVTLHSFSDVWRGSFSQ